MEWIPVITMGHRPGSPSFMNLPGIPYPWVKDVNRLRDLIIVKCSNVEISVYDNAITLNSIVGCPFPQRCLSHHLPKSPYLSDFRLQTSDFRLRTSQTFEILVQRQASHNDGWHQQGQSLSGVSSAEGGSEWRTNPNACNCAANSGGTSQSE